MKSHAVVSGGEAAAVGKALTRKLMITVALQFLLCRCRMFGIVPSFGTAICGAIPLPYAWLSVLTAVLGYASQGISPDTLPKILSAVLLFFWRAALSRIDSKPTAAANAFLTGCVILCAEVVRHFYAGFFWPALLSTVCEALLAGGFCYLSSRAIEAFLDGHSYAAATGEERFGWLVVGILTITALMRTELSFFTCGLIAMGFLTCLACGQLGSTYGALAAIFIGIGCNLYQTDYLTITATCVVSALCAGVFRPYGRLAVAAVFLTAEMFSLLVFGITLKLLSETICLALGAVLYLGTKQNLHERLLPADLCRPTAKDFSLKEHTERRIHFAALMTSELEQLVETVGDRLSRNLPEDHLLDLYRDTVTIVCNDCPERDFCWKEHDADTAAGFLMMTRRLKQGKRPNSEDMEESFLNHCIRKEELVDHISSRYRKLTKRLAQKKQSDDLRALASQQFAGITEVLTGIEEELDNINLSDEQATAQIRTLFTELAAPPISTFVSLNENDRMEIDLFCNAAVQFDEETLRREFTRVLHRAFATPMVTQAQNQVRISFFEEALFSPVYHIAQAAGSDSENVCGDTCLSFTDCRGTLYFLLSDGMGTGKDAALDSSLTCTMVQKLIKAGFGMDSVIKFVNSTLQANRPEETLATIDLAQVDLYTGRVEFYKAGSASSFVCLNHVVAEVSSNSLPLGILQGVRFDRRVATLQDGDLLLLVSDGVLPADHQRFKRYLESHANDSPAQLANRLIDEVKSHAPDGRYDDLSVIAVQLCENH